MKELYIVPCGSKKIFDKIPKLKNVPAKRVYTGGYTKTMIKYVERLNVDYVIFSGVYGIIPPNKLLNQYDSGGKRIIPLSQLKEQIKYLNFEKYDTIISICNNEFNRTLDELKINYIHFYNPNLLLGQRFSFLLKKLKETTI